MKILVTGGLGFVGVNIVRGLAAQPGVQVVAADVLPWDSDSERFLAPVRGQVIHRPLDVCDANAVAEIMQGEAITHVVHAAAITVGDAAERMRAVEVVAVNLEGSIHLLNAALAQPTVARVLVVSSSGVYGTAHADSFQPQRETDPLDLTNLYAITKYSTELLAARYAVLSGRQMAAVRLPAVYGPMERSHASRRHTSALHQLMVALRAGRSVFVAGADIARDWTYAADIAAGVWALLNAAQWHYPVYNLSCGVALPFHAVVEAFVAAGLYATWIDDTDQADIAMRAQQARAPLDIARIGLDAGWQPAYPLRVGVEAWLREEGGDASRWADQAPLQSHRQRPLQGRTN